MARRVRDKDIETREARRKLKLSGKPHWKAIGLGLHVGYRKGRRGGVWVVRRYCGGQRYKVESIALADDIENANGVEVLDFWQAQTLAREMRTPGARGAGGYTVGQAVADYLAEHLEGRASYYDCGRRLRAYVLPVFGDKPVAELEADEIRKWHRDVAKKSARARTRPGASQNYRKSDDDPEATRKRQASANRCLSLFKAVLNYAWAEERVKCERVWQRVKPFRGVDVPRTRYLTVAECQRLINTASPDFRVLVQAALQTGARYQELARLRASDFNPDAGTLHIRRSKAAKDRHIVLTEEGQRFFAQLATGKPGSALLLGREWKHSQQQLPMVTACKRAKIDGASFHTLRHTWASLAVMAGAPLMVVAKNLGHVDTRMVERHYGHLAPSFVADAIRAAAPRFGMVEPSNVRTL
jgi:integrase